MGMPGPFGAGCLTNPRAPAPNPDPSRWTLLRGWEFENACVVEVRYYDCTNFEGRKVMVFRGGQGAVGEGGSLDPHFCRRDNALMARFRPDAAGIAMAIQLAENYSAEERATAEGEPT